MLSFPNVMHLFAYKFAPLGTGRLAFSLIFLGAFQRELVILSAFVGTLSRWMRSKGQKMAVVGRGVSQS